MTRFPYFVLVIACVFGQASVAGPFQMTPDKLDRRMLKCAERFGRLQSDSATAIPSDVLNRARGIIILHHLKAGFLGGGDGGHGVALVRHPQTGRWSAPAFVASGGASFGFQAGVKQSTVVYVLMDDRALGSLVNGSLNVGADVGAVAGPRNASVRGDTITATAPILIYDDSGGLFAGFALKGSAIRPAGQANRVYYGRTLPQIVFEHSVQPTPSGIVVIESLHRAAGQAMHPAYGVPY